MNSITVLPDKKLKSKLYLVLGTASFYVLIVALILQITIPLGKKTSSDDVAAILWPIVLGIILLIFLIGTPLIILWIKNLQYNIGLERINLNKGILTKIQQNIPYRAITDFMLHRSLYDRLLGLASIRIQTAGQSQTPTGYEANMAGLTNWEEIMRELRNRLKPEKELAEENAVPITNFADIFSEILSELKSIRNLLERKK